MRNPTASIIIFLFDVLAFVSAFIVSTIFTQYIAAYIFGSPQSSLFLLGSTGRTYKFIFMSAAVLFAFYNRGHYTRRIPWWNQVRFVFITLIIAFLIDGFSFFALKYQFSRIWTGLYWVIGFFIIITFRWVSKSICERLKIWQIDTIVIGSGDNAIDAIYALNSETYTGYYIKSLILTAEYDSFDRNNLPSHCRDIPIIDGSTQYFDYINNHKNSFYIIAPDALLDMNIEKTIEIITDSNNDYAVVPPIKGLSLYGNAPQFFFGHDIMLMQSRSKINSPFGRIVKRGMDIAGSVFLLIVLFPLFLLIAVLIKKDGGCVVFRNKRLGINGKEFDCLKFRSMIINAEAVLSEVLEKDPEVKALWETHRKMKNDPRITWIGKFLRKSSLDELPQLINILKGEMSLVGPRPILPDEVEFFNKWQLDNYYSVRPGMTGLWQVSGRNDTSFKQRVHLDDWYVKNWSIWHDIVIIFKTVSVLVKRRGAY